jgi:hypothetical protein
LRDVIGAVLLDERDHRRDRIGVVLRREHFRVPAGRDQSTHDGALQRGERAAAGERALLFERVGLRLRGVGRGLFRRRGFVGLLPAQLLNVGVGVQLRLEQKFQREHRFVV